MATHAGFATLEDAARWFDQRRWYGDKGRTIASLRSIFHADAMIGDRALQIQCVRIGFSPAGSSMYLLLRNPDDVDVDSIEDPAVRRWLMDGFRAGRTLEGASGQLTWSTTERLDATADRIASTSRVFRGEQSNTSIVYDDQVMIKMIRKLQPGRNPEVEIGQHLTSNTDFNAFPRLLGTISLVSGEDTTTIAAAQQFIPSKGDVWSWMLDGLVDPAFAETATEAAYILGQRTAQMHAALAVGAGDAFTPELITGDYVDLVHGESLRELEDTVAQLDARRVSDARELGEALKKALADLRELEGTYRIRIHGDYHLGQVLRTNEHDFAILDFEGEPSRSLEERRAKASPLRDVAGMLRSFDYAAETAHRRYPEVSSDGFVSWRVAVRQAFVDGYTTTVDGSQPLTHGFDFDRRQRLIAAFEAHKALYEVRYELGNRPDWLEIPMGGLRRIADNSV